MKCRAVLAVLWIACSSQACKARAPAPAAAASSALASVASATPAPVDSAARLPEDPVAGARALAALREHLVEEERERKANYDRRHMKEHRALLASLAAARARYDGAKSPAAVQKLQADSGRLRGEISRRLDALDRWKNSSALLDDYTALLDALSQDYPAARVRALSGDAVQLERVRRDVDAHFQKAEKWLQYAAEAEGE